MSVKRVPPAEAKSLMDAGWRYVDVRSIPEFEGKDFGTVYTEAAKILKRFPSLKDSVKALGELSSQTVKNKCYLLAADIAMASGDVDEAEDAMLEAMQRVLQVEDSLATKILEVLTLKYARA